MALGLPDLQLEQTNEADGKPKGQLSNQTLANKLKGTVWGNIAA